MKWLQIGISALAAFAISWMLHTIDVNRIEKKHEKAINDQIAADTLACDNAKAIAKGANDDLLKSCDSRIKRCNAIRMQPAKCVNLQPSEQAELTTDRSRSMGSNGISANWLLGYSSESCKRYYDERILLEKWIDDTIKANQK